MHKPKIAPSISISLYGSFKVESADGRDITPTSQKAQGLLALLATSNDLSRGRSWVQSVLWSDRAREQASGSMRQALAQIKAAFGPEYSSVLQANRRHVWLDEHSVRLTKPDGRTFLESIDVQDSAFTAWLDHQPAGPRPQLVRPDAPTRRGARKFDIVCTSLGGELATWFNRVFCDATARHLREFFSADVYIDYAGRPDKDIWQIRLESYVENTNNLYVRLSLENPAQQRQIWSDNRNVEARGGPPVEDPDILRLLNELVQAIGDEFLKDSTFESDSADLLCRRAIRAFFTLEKDGVAEADDLIRRAFEIEPRGLFLAWRGQIRTVQGIERHLSDQQAIVQEGEQFAEQALEIEPNNSMVLATAANTFGHLLKQKSRSLDLAKEAVLQNRVNPMAWWALSSAHAYAGDIKQSYRSALTARKLALLSPHRFWWDTQAFGPAMLLGQISEARNFAESSFARNRTFKSNLRYLIAFYANDEDPEGALAFAKRLKTLEPDFSVERLVNDRDYPVSLLHRTPGLDLDKLKALC